MWLVVGFEVRESEDTAKVMSGRVITLAYIRINHLPVLVCPLGVSRLGEMRLSLGEIYTGFMGVAAGLNLERTGGICMLWRVRWYWRHGCV